MPTPLFALRLPQALQDEIKEMAKACGAPNPRAFLRELIETVLSGDMARVGAFNERLVSRALGQMKLPIESVPVVAKPHVTSGTSGTSVTREKRITRKTRIKRKPRNERTT